MTREQITALSRLGVSTHAAFCGPNLTPETFQVFGIRLDERTPHALILTSARLFPWVREIESGNRQVAVTFSQPRTYLTAQIKGVVQAVRPVTEEDLRLHESWGSLIAPEYVAVGIQQSTLASLEITPDIAIEIDIDSYFSQTPGPGAGFRV